MRKLIAFSAPLALACATAPAHAQWADDEAAQADVMADLAEMFPVEPLTAEEQARLPAATALIDKIVPSGTLGEMMGLMLDGILGPMIEMETGNAVSALETKLGVDNLDIAPERAAQALAILDPAWEERGKREVELMPIMMERMFVAMEPTMKSAMSELYAVYFDTQEIADISAFFDTSSGASYARKSFTMSADPRMVGAMMQAMPDMMGAFAQMEAEMAAATADLPAERGFADLAIAERKKLVSLTGLEEAAIADGMAGSGR